VPDADRQKYRQTDKQTDSLGPTPRIGEQTEVQTDKQTISVSYAKELANRQRGSMTMTDTDRERKRERDRQIERQYDDDWSNIMSTKRQYYVNIMTMEEIITRGKWEDIMTTEGILWVTTEEYYVAKAAIRNGATRYFFKNKK